MENNIEPQIIYVFDKNKKISDIYFLTFLDDITNTKQYSLFEFYLKNNSEVFKTKSYKIIKNHILLTLTLEETRGYIRNILNINEKILMFSLNNNLDYKEVGSDVFNPFNIVNICEKNLDTLVLYEVYENIAYNSIFCIIRDIDYNKKEMCSFGIYNKNIEIFIKHIFSNNYDFTIKYNENKNTVFDLYLTDSFIYYIKKNIIKKKINIKNNENVYLSGDYITLLDLDNIKKLKIEFYDNDVTNKEVMILDDKLIIKNIHLFEKILLSQEKLNNYLVLEKLFKKKIIIDFYNITLNSIILDYDIDFFINITKKTKNIFLDRTKKINIITSSNHIIFISYKIYPELFNYLTSIIIMIQIYKKNVIYNKPMKKIDDLYLSRYCQSFRKPHILDSLNEINLENYIKLNNIVYRHKNDETGDIYIDDKILYHCKNTDLKYLSFINEIYRGYNICLPCCYKNKKNDNEIYKKCIEKNIKKDKILFSHYLFVNKKYRIIIDPYKIGGLVDKLEIVFNENKELQTINLDLENRILNANNYIIYLKHDIDKIKSYDNVVLIKDDILEFKKITNINNLVFLLEINKKMHILKSLNKKNNNLYIEDVPLFVKERFFNKYLDIQMYNFDYNIYNFNTKYEFIVENINLKKNTLGYFITEVLYKDFFKIIISENIEVFKKIFLINLYNQMNDNKIKFNKNFIKKDIDLINHIKTFLNKDFISEKI